MADRCAGMKFLDPSGTIYVKIRGDFFVGDTATGVTLNTVFLNFTILQQLAHDKQIHAHFLFTMGHKLALDKCSYYILTFVRDGIRHRCCLIHECPGEMHLRETFTSNPVKVKRLQPFTAHKTLGCHIVIDGNQRRQYKVLSEKVSNWNRRITTSFLLTNARLVSYEAYIKKSVQYVAPTHSFDQQQCHELDKHITPVLFHAHSVQKNCSKCILYGPSLYGGYAYYDSWYLKGVEKLKFLFMHYRRHGIAGKLYKITMRWTQLELGFPDPFYKYKYEACKGYITSAIITDLWEYISLCNATLREQQPWIYTPPRLNDFFLNYIVCRSNIPSEHKQIFNEVRIHLHLITASDIVSLNSGAKILPNILRGINNRSSSLQWPNTLPFPPHWITIWKNIVTTIIQPIIQTSPLGAWTSQTHQV